MVLKTCSVLRNSRDRWRERERERETEKHFGLILHQIVTDKKERKK
jgi:hypothetical protein